MQERGGGAGVQRGHSMAKRSYPGPQVRGSDQEELACVQGKEQGLRLLEQL